MERTKAPNQCDYLTFWLLGTLPAHAFNPWSIQGYEQLKVRENALLELMATFSNIFLKCVSEDYRSQTKYNLNLEMWGRGLIKD